eukprot:15473544-Alexandrium_andersonii.AAC.1
MSPRNCCAPLPAPWPPERSDQVGPPGSSPASAPKPANVRNVRVAHLDARRGTHSCCGFRSEPLQLLLGRQGALGQ